MDGSQVSILEQGDEVSLGGLLESHDGGGLEAQIGLRSRVLDHETRGVTQTGVANLEVLGNLTNETLEGQLADQELSGLLVTPGREDRMSHQPRDGYVERESYLISRRATVPGRNLWGFLTPPVGF